MSMESVGLSRLRAATSCYALRRTKELLEKAIKLPKKTVTIAAIPFKHQSIHKTVHDVVYEGARMVLVKLFDAGEQTAIARSFEMLMVLLLCVRQSCYHASLVPVECRERAQELHREFIMNGGVLDPEEAVSVLARLVGTSDTRVTASSSAVTRASGMETSPKIEALLEYVEIEM
mmetsp:Transcript_17411/g.28908  ORF Transcript_17411/g.28908 Transcript_17411/m.28908 type:complete len:175 (-) Transcript_17411:145-669(-)